MSQKPVRKPIIGVMGPGSPDDPALLDHAKKLGKAIALNNWILLTGGRGAGVMDAASRGAFEAGGTTIGILPGSNRHGVSEYVQIPIITGMGNARNVINILSSDVIILCGIGPGTVSEAVIAIKMNKPLIVTRLNPEDHRFLNRLSAVEIPFFNLVDDIIAEIRKILFLKKPQST